MYTSIRHLGIRRWLAAEAPTLALSLIAAELLYKFHSFTLECLAFLATWSALSYLSGLASRVRPPGPRGRPGRSGIPSQGER